MYFVRSISFAVFRLRECVFECRVFVCVVVGRLVFRSFRLDGGCGGDQPDCHPDATALAHGAASRLARLDCSLRSLWRVSPVIQVMKFLFLFFCFLDTPLLQHPGSP